MIRCPGTYLEFKVRNVERIQKHSSSRHQKSFRIWFFEIFWHLSQQQTGSASVSVDNTFNDNFNIKPQIQMIEMPCHASLEIS